MKIGIISDTHGHDARLGAAMAVLTARGVRAVVHCGDIGSTQCVRTLAGAGVEAWLVAGNMDRHLDGLEREAQVGNVHFARDFVALPIGGGRHLAVTHGDGRILDELLHSDYAYICHGHTHRLRDEWIGRTRIINPGALARAARHTVAVLDTDLDELEIIEIRDE
ncbi:MAG: metallophosphoesterase [Phycisphaerae bacterium]